MSTQLMDGLRRETQVAHDGNSSIEEPRNKLNHARARTFELDTARSSFKVGGIWRYLFRAIDHFGQVIDVFLSPRRDAGAAVVSSSERSIGPGSHQWRSPPDRYRAYPRIIDDRSAAFHDMKAYANNPIETDHGRLKAGFDPCED